MGRWIKRFARITGTAVFFAVFLTAVDYADPFDLVTTGLAFLRALAAALLFWVAGYVLGDIIFKSVVETVSHADVPVFEGGLIQHAREESERMRPEATASAEKPETKKKKK